MQGRDIDIAILGGGLAGGLIALALTERRPELSVALIERDDHLGGNHVWSFFRSDVAPGDRWLTDPLVATQWPGYLVHFPAHTRILSTPYLSITDETFDAALRERLPEGTIMCGETVREAWRDRVILEGGKSIDAGGVIDARGVTAMPGMRGGWQKFVGQMLRLSRPHGLSRPILMDARITQHACFRFVYVLPYSERDIFIEDTYYADTPDIDMPVIRDRIDHYAKSRGWSVYEVIREESGALPVIADGNFDTFWPHGGDAPARAGTRAALVHPLTSYSLPDAVRFALKVAGMKDPSGAALAEMSYRWSKAHWRRGRFNRMLSRMLYGAAEPEERYRMLERFYTLPEPLIERFYAGRSTRMDHARILTGRPPVSVFSALLSIMGGGRPLARLDGRP